jgi:hypothetical protein
VKTTMNVTHAWRQFLGAGGAFAFAACTATAAPDQRDVAAVQAAVTLIECQTQAAECLGLFPDATKIADCRHGLETCVGDVAANGEAQASAVGMCAQSGIECARSAMSFDQAAMCRANLEDCARGSITLPDPPMISPPDLPDLSGAAMCRDTARSCVESAGSASDVGECGTKFTDCLSALVPSVPTGTAPALPSPPSLDAVRACREQGVTCVSAASDVASIATCAQTFRECLVATL